MTKFKNIALAIASVVIFGNVTLAQGVQASSSSTHEEPLKVKYLGEEGGYLLFEVTLQAKRPSNAVFALTDKIEGELYASGLVANYKVQTMKIEKRDKQELDFKLVVETQTFLKSFSVNTSMVETTSVAENQLTRL